MSNRASPAGWVVQITVSSPTAEPSSLRSSVPTPPVPSFRFFNVAIASPHEAIEVAIKAAKAPDAIGRAVRALSADEVAALRLGDGQAKPA